MEYADREERLLDIQVLPPSLSQFFKLNLIKPI